MNELQNLPTIISTSTREVYSVLRFLCVYIERLRFWRIVKILVDWVVYVETAISNIVRSDWTRTANLFLLTRTFITKPLRRLTNKMQLFKAENYLNALLLMSFIGAVIMRERERESSSSSLSSQDIWAFFHIQSQHSEKGGIQDRMKEKLRYNYQYHHTYLPPPLPPNSYRSRGGEERREEEPRKTQSHSHSCSFRSWPVILGGITNRMKDLKVN